MYCQIVYYCLFVVDNNKVDDKSSKRSREAKEKQRIIFSFTKEMDIRQERKVRFPYLTLYFKKLKARNCYLLKQ